MEKENLFQIEKRPSLQEITTLLAQGKQCRIERIVSTGQVSGWYDQEEWEFVSVLQGTGQLTWEDGTVTDLAAGDFLTIAPHVRHRVSYTSQEPPCVWLCMFWK